MLPGSPTQMGVYTGNPIASLRCHMRTHLLSAVILLSLAACSQQAPEAPTPGTPAPEAAVSEAAADASTTDFKGVNGLMSGTAESAPTCSAPAVVSVTWNVGGKAATESVKLYVGDGANAKLFTAGGAQGSGQTGPWVSPGGVFVLRNGRDEAELDRMTIPGPACH